MLETPEPPVCTPYQNFLLQIRYTGLLVCNAAIMLVKANVPRLTEAYARLMWHHKIKRYAVWHYSASVVTNYSFYREFCNLILNFVFVCTATNLSQNFSCRERKRYYLSDLVKNLLLRNKWTKIKV